MKKVESGKEYYVHDESEPDVEVFKDVRTAIGTDSKGKHHFESVNPGERSTIWKHFVEIPEPKIIPWTIDTCPVPPFCVKTENDPWLMTVVEADMYTVTITNGLKLTYQDLMIGFKRTNQDRTTSPCGEAVGE